MRRYHITIEVVLTDEDAQVDDLDRIVEEIEYAVDDLPVVSVYSVTVLPPVEQQPN
jgi:hypothetical protein